MSGISGNPGTWVARISPSVKFFDENSKRDIYLHNYAFWFIHKSAKQGEQNSSNGRLQMHTSSHKISSVMALASTTSNQEYRTTNATSSFSFLYIELIYKTR